MLRKRCHSFEDDLHPQSKTHVGEKEINLGVNMDQNMKAVYAKTLEMLFKASPKKLRSDNPVTSTTAVHNSCTTAARFKQMFLDSNCKLQSQGNLKENQFQSTCGFCGSSWYCHQKCAFCEKYLCESCKCACRKCEQPFCSSCIFSMFEGHDEYAICRTCY